jgi:hypothetical protein
MFDALRLVDWLVLWKFYYYPLFFWSYIACGIPLRMIAVSRLHIRPGTRAWILSSTTSAPLVFLMPALALPAFAIVVFAGDRASYSALMALPIAVSIGAFGALVDTALFRFVLRNAMSLREFWWMFTTNAVNVFLAVLIVLGWVIAYPTEFIASLNC